MIRVYLLISTFSFFSLFLDAQCLQGNCNNGKGLYQFKSGSKFKGEFKNGKIFKFGTFYFKDGRKYTGQWKNQRIAGKGKMTFPQGYLYEGEFSSSKFHGEGVIHFPNGDRFEAKWNMGQPKGNGTYYFNNGDSELGNWQNGSFVSTRKHQNDIAQYKDEAKSDDYINCNTNHCRSGTGRYTYKDGSYFEGEFRAGYPDGQGTCYYANGDKYTGGWKNNAPQGEGIMYFSSGLVYGAEWSAGYPIKRLNKINPPSQRPSSIKQQNAFDEEVRIYAVIVGIAAYNHMPTLKYTDDDAYQMYAFLKSPEGGALPDERISLLIDESASRSNILRAMKSTFAKADRNDVIMLYYSGHGLPGSFLPIDFDGYNNVIEHYEIKEILEQSEAKHKICFADACHSGSMLAMKSPFNATKMNSFFEGFEKADAGTALFTSSKSEEISMETTGLRQGIYSHYLIRGLSGEADFDNNKIVSISELYLFVSKNVKSYTGNRQNPVIAGNYDEDMPVAIVR
jgi:hypothetical protein